MLDKLSDHINSTKNVKYHPKVTQMRSTKPLKSEGLTEIRTSDLLFA